MQQPHGTDADASSGVIQSVDRALTILDLLAEADGDLGITEIGDLLGVHKSTASRLVATLRAHDFVEQVSESGRYRLGAGLLRMSGAATRGLELIQLARPTLRRLCSATDETVNLAVLSEDEALYVDQVTAGVQLLSNAWLGRRTPLHASAAGKVLLAWAPDPRLLNQVCRSALQRKTPRTITQGPLLRREIERVRVQGWAVAVDELEEGLTAYAAPVRDASGEAVASICVSGPGVRLAPRQDEMLAKTVLAAAEISARLGFVED